MPPKRRKSVQASDAPEPKRRVTRSTTKNAAVNVEATVHPIASTTKLKRTAKSPTPSTPPSKSSKSKSSKHKTIKNAKNNTSKPDAQAKASKTKYGESSTTHENKTGSSTDLTIKHASLKNPIACQNHEGAEFSFSRLVFTHGAGGTLSAPAVVNFCTGYSSRLPIFLFQGSMNLGSRVKGFHACISHLDSEHEANERKKRSPMNPYRELILGGRSMGARAAVVAATENLQRRSQTIHTHLVLVSYPLQGPKDVRDQILLDLKPNINVLFVSGERDAMCPLDLLKEVRQKMKAKSWLIVVEGADHGMHGGGLKKEKALGEEVGRLSARWVRGLNGGVMEKRLAWDEEQGAVRVVDVDV